MPGAATIQKLRSEEEEAVTEVWKYVFGFVDMAVVKCAIELGIADVLHSHATPVSLLGLSSATGCSQAHLRRLMRFLVHRRIFKETPAADGSVRYSATPLSRLLVRHGERSMAALILLESSPAMMAPWHCLSECVRSGMARLPFQAAFGDDVWGFNASNPTQSTLLNDAMACDTRVVVVPAMIKDCPEVFDGVASLVDVGGGNGTTLRMLVEAFPWLSGINFDLPHVVSTASLSERVQNVGGSMFDGIPHGDAILLKWILHDWGDEDCVKILRKCRESIPAENGKVIIVEAILKEDGGIAEDEWKQKQGDFVMMLDMTMMAVTNNGKERTLKEWDCLLGEAGFGRCHVKQIHALQSVIVAYPYCPPA